MIRTVFLMGACLASVALVASEGPRDIHLETFVSAALERDPDVADARAESNWQSSRAGTVPVWEDPELRLGTENREDRGDQTSLRLRIPIPNPWEARSEQDRADARAQGETARLEAVAWERGMELATVYFDAVYAGDVLALRKELLDGLESDLGDAERGLEAGVISIPRIIDLRGERALAAARLAKEDVGYSILVEEIRARAGWPEQTIARLTTPLPRADQVDGLPSLETLRNLAFRERGALEALAADEREDEALNDQARARSLPWITFLEGTWLHEADRGRDDYEARIAISLPVFSMLRRSQTEEALRLIRSRDRMRSFSIALEAALQSARHRAEASGFRFQTVHAATAASLDEIGKALSSNAITPQSRSGLRDISFDLKKERLEAARDYQMALLDLMLITGPNASSGGTSFASLTSRDLN